MVTAQGTTVEAVVAEGATAIDTIGPTGVARTLTGVERTLTGGARTIRRITGAIGMSTGRTKEGTATDLPGMIAGVTTGQ